jgi:hypothetical protein
MNKFQNQNGYHYPHSEPEEVNGDEEGFALTDEIDHHVLMHRDAHFGGDFTVMLNYYRDDENIGIHPDFDIERIAYLAEVEKEIGQDLAPLILTGVEAEAVGKARQAYSRLKEIYYSEEEKSRYPQLIADLILAETEEPVAEIESIVAQGTSILPELLALIRSDEMYDPLFPGYGFAPYLAILCLGSIGSPEAIVPIFDILSKETVFDETVVIEGLAEIGNPAKEFLLKVVCSRPLTQDNAHAAFALTPFSHDPQVAIICFEQLQDSDVQDKSLLRTYLICNCEALDKTPYKQDFITMSQDHRFPKEMRRDMSAIIEGWGKQ